jgi:hypothetical protein
MVASASAQQAAHAEAEQQLLDRLKSTEASLAGYAEAEQAIKAGLPFLLATGQIVLLSKDDLWQLSTALRLPWLMAYLLSGLSHDGPKTYPTEC